MNENQENETVPSAESKADIIRREIKTYVLRIGRMAAAQEKAYEELAPRYGIPYENHIINLMDIFGNSNPVIIEIGFGMGDATWQIAKANPDVNYLGIEVHRPGVGKLLHEIKKNDLKNLLIVVVITLESIESILNNFKTP